MPHLRSCHCCGLVQIAPDEVRGDCARCATQLGSWLGLGWHNQLAAAFAWAALALYVPAMWLPFLRIERLGQAHASNLLGGVRSLLSEGHLLVGLIVLLFSVFLPVVKLGALLILTQARERLGERNRALVYRLVEHLGRWGMLDVLLVAVMVAFVKLGGLVEFSAGPGLVVFASFVLLSLCASATFDPFALWDDGVVLAGRSAAGELNRPSEATTIAVDHLPTADHSPPPKRGWVWLIPLAAVAVAAGLGFDAWSTRGRVIEVAFQDGRGIARGADLRYHGIICGQVEGVRLGPELDGVVLDLRLTTEADGLARLGARFWIVRPQADLTGIAGLETLVGAKYVTLLPGPDDGPLANTFVGLEEPPVPDLEEPGGLEIVLQSSSGEGLRRGVGVYYRDLRIGGVVSTGLAGDGSAIETRVYIRPGYRHLIRERTVFWNDSGVRLRGGLTELSLHIGTAETLLRGGIALALPDDAGLEVSGGQRFVLHPRPEEEWLEWQPAVQDGSPGFEHEPPQLELSVLRWTDDGFFVDRERERRGWLLPTREGWRGPSDLLTVPDGALDSRAVLSVRGRDHVLTSPEHSPTESAVITIQPAEHADAPSAATVPERHPAAPEDLYLTTTTDSQPLLIAAVRCRPKSNAWIIDPTLPISSEWHGAAAIAASDGALLGRLVCSDEYRVVVLETADGEPD